MSATLFRFTLSSRLLRVLCRKRRYKQAFLIKVSASSKCLLGKKHVPIGGKREKWLKSPVMMIKAPGYFV